MGARHAPIELCALAAVVAAGLSCSQDGPSTGPDRVSVSVVELTPSSGSIPVGGTIQLTATTKDASGNLLTGRPISWSSVPTSVATVSSSGLVTGVVAGSAVVTAASEGRTATAQITVSAPGFRSQTDRTDEASGSQIHVIYLLPSDGPDRGLDTTGALANSVGSFQNWLAGQTGGRRLRLDTHGGGRVDITFRRLGRSDGTMRSYGLFVRDTIEKDLAAAGFSSAAKIYAVYYDGTATNTCGGGAWPPQLPGRVAAMYLRGTFTSGAPPCDSNPLAGSPTAPPGYLEYAMRHELLHTMGIVSLGAPNHTLSGHVNTDPVDLMYAGPLAWRPSVLDANRSNYFSPGGLPAGIYNLAASPFLLP